VNWNSSRGWVLPLQIPQRFRLVVCLMKVSSFGQYSISSPVKVLLFFQNVAAVRNHNPFQFVLTVSTGLSADDAQKGELSEFSKSAGTDDLIFVLLVLYSSGPSTAKRRHPGAHRRGLRRRGGLQGLPRGANTIAGRSHATGRPRTTRAEGRRSKAVKLVTGQAPSTWQIQRTPQSCSFSQRQDRKRSTPNA
jgi:hypothetical protein